MTIVNYDTPPFGLHHLASPKLGGASAKLKKNMLFYTFAFGLHHLASPQLGGTSAKQKKNMLFFCFALGLH
jgi:hypothetical protein